jgi:hypothetical protein
MLSATFVYAGYSDYFQGHSERDCEEYSEHLLYAFYGRNTSLRDIIDQLVEDSYSGPASESLPEDVFDSDVRAALLDMLTDEGRADYLSCAIAECSAAWMDANPLDECPCGDYTPDGEGEEECPECGHIFDNDEHDDYESPIFVVVLRVDG